MKSPKRILSLILAIALSCSTIGDPVFASSIVEKNNTINENAESEADSETIESTETEFDEEEQSELMETEEQEEQADSVDLENQQDEIVQKDVVSATSEESQKEVATDESIEEQKTDKEVSEEELIEETDDKNTEWITEIYVNPLYADVIDESDLNKPDEDEIAQYSEDGCANLQEAAEYLRNSMVERTQEVEIHFL